MLTEDDDQLENVTTVESTSPTVATQPSTASQTVSSTPSATPSALPSQVEPLLVTVQPRAGIRNLRGKPTSVPTGHLDIMVDGKQRAWTRVEKGYPIRALAEFLAHEIPQLQAAVVSYRGDTDSPEFRPLPKGTNDEIAKLQKM